MKMRQPKGAISILAAFISGAASPILKLAIEPNAIATLFLIH